MLSLLDMSSDDTYCRASVAGRETGSGAPRVVPLGASQLSGKRDATPASVR
jgi:hypothetical protein